MINLENKINSLIELNIHDYASDNDDNWTRGWRKRFRIVLEEIMKGEETWNSKVFDEYLDDDDLGKGNRPYKAAQAILYKLNNYNFKSDLKDSLKQLAIDFSEAFGGESGPLWYTFISCAAEKLEDELIKNTWKNWISAY